MSATKTIYSHFGNEAGKFDLSSFVEAAVLFDKVLVESSMLVELIRVTGVEGVLVLLETGLLSFAGGDPSAQAKCYYKQPGFFSNRPLDRPLRFAFETIYSKSSCHGNPSVAERLSRSFEDTTETLNIGKKAQSEVVDAVLKSIRLIDGESLNPKDDFRNDIHKNHGLVAGVLTDHLIQRLKLPVLSTNFHIQIEEVHDDIFQIDTNLGEIFGYSPEEAHEHLKTPFFEFTGTSLQLHRMRVVEAASGLTDVQAAITAKRADFLSRLLEESDVRPTFTRILETVNVPIVARDAQLDAQALVKLRDSDEAALFRNWIQCSHSMSQQEITNLVSGWDRKLGETLKTGKAKAARWLVSTGAGLALGDVTGIGAGILDNYLGKLLPGTGPIGFVSRDYRAFVEKQNAQKTRA